jgi:serine/threonine-protein kinase
MYDAGVERCGFDHTELVERGDDRLVGTTIDRYRIVEVLGSGAVGCVYRARHDFLGTEFAVKVLSPELCGEKFLERFRREARSASEIRHPNVIHIQDFGITKEGQSFLVMEMVRGKTLARAIQDTAPFSPERAARILRQLMAGLDAAHSRGFVHRDIKPSNVMLVLGPDGEQVKILDFGAVSTRDAEYGRKLTATGHLVGTPAYMAPEQCLAEEVTPATDIYAAGVILFEMISGRSLFRGTASEMMLKHVAAEPPPAPPSLGLEEIAAAMLAKSPAARPQGAAQVMQMIDELFSTLADDASFAPTLDLHFQRSS